MIRHYCHTTIDTFMQGIVASADKKVIFIASPGDGKQFLRKHLNVFITEGYSSQIKNLDWIDAVISNPTSIEQLLATETREGDLKEKKRSLIARNEHGIVPNEYFDTENRLLIDNPLLSFITNNRVREYAKQVSKERSIREYNLFIQTLISITRFGIRELFLSTPERDSLEKSIALLGHPLEISSLKIPKGLKINYEVVFSLIDEQAFYLKEFYLKHPSIPHDMLDVSDHPIFKESTILTRKRGGLHIIPKSKGRNPLESDISIPVEFVSIDPEEAAAMLGVAHYTMHPERIPKYAFGLRIRGADTPFSLVSFDPMDRNFKEDLVALSGLDPKKALELTKLYDVDNCPIKSASELFNMAIEALRREHPDLQAILANSNPNFFTHKIQRALGFIPIGTKPTRTYFRIERMPEKIYIYTPRRKVLDLGVDIASRENLPLLPTFQCIRLVGKWAKAITPIAELYTVKQKAYMRGL